MQNSLTDLTASIINHPHHFFNQISTGNNYAVARDMKDPIIVIRGECVRIQPGLETVGSYDLGNRTRRGAMTSTSLALGLNPQKLSSLAQRLESDQMIILNYKGTSYFMVRKSSEKIRITPSQDKPINHDIFTDDLDLHLSSLQPSRKMQIAMDDGQVLVICHQQIIAVPADSAAAFPSLDLKPNSQGALYSGKNRLQRFFAAVANGEPGILLVNGVPTYAVTAKDYAP